VLFIGVQDFVRVYINGTYSPLWFVCDLLGRAKVRMSVGRILRYGSIQVVRPREQSSFCWKEIWHNIQIVRLQLEIKVGGWQN
jgi:hypothetical protein